ncbi:MAG TPA: 30S ribosomal protein S19 [Planctomycetota bacterium]|nr:30S ribosomal protein S19 [Planctomycetota bacterium]
MSRSLKKGPFVEPKLIIKAAKSKAGGGRDAIKTWSRRSTIVPDFVNLSFLVHNGKTFVKVFVTEDMVGHKLGEFAPTRSFRGHPGTKAADAAKPGAKG